MTKGTVAWYMVSEESSTSLIWRELRARRVQRMSREPCTQYCSLEETTIQSASPSIVQCQYAVAEKHPPKK